jgi:predicted GTPase
MGYSATQRRELEETINRAPCDLILVATPIDLAHIVTLRKPHVRVSYEVEEPDRPELAQLVAQFAKKHSSGQLRRGL